MPQCCFCFLQTSGEYQTDPTGKWLYRTLVKGETITLVTGKGRLGKIRQALLWQTPTKAQRSPDSSEMWLVLPMWHSITQTQRLQCLFWQGFLIKWKTIGFLVKKRLEKIRSQGSSSLNRQKHTTFYLQAEKPSLLLDWNSFIQQN